MNTRPKKRDVAEFVGWLRAPQPISMQSLMTGCALSAEWIERLYHIATKAADQNNCQAKRISALESTLREIIARWDADCGSRMAAELPDAIEAARELIAEEMEIPQ
jgi:hypothetical protein